MSSLGEPTGSEFGAESTGEEVVAGTDMAGKVVVVTGGASGLGLEVTRVLARAGAFVIVGARDVATAEAALVDVPGSKVRRIDLGDPQSIATFAEDVVALGGRNIDVLVNNAGVMAVPLDHNSRGVETHFAVNYLGHFELTRLLWPALAAGAGGRVVNLTSRAYRFATPEFDPGFDDHPYDKWAAYGQSMAAKALFTIELDERGRRHGVRAFAVHPGTIMTDLSRHLTRAELVAMGAVDDAGTNLTPAGYKTVPQGAATTVWAATSPNLDRLGGLYLEDCDIAHFVDSTADLFGSGVDAWVVDPDRAHHLWTDTERLLGVKFDPDHSAAGADLNDPYISSTAPLRVAAI